MLPELISSQRNCVQSQTLSQRGDVSILSGQFDHKNESTYGFVVSDAALCPFCVFRYPCGGYYIEMPTRAVVVR